MSLRADTFLLYGATDAGKSSQLGELARWHFEKTGQISRLISADSGWDPIEPLVITPERPDGIIEAWNVQALPDPWAILIELSEGAWPQVIQTETGFKAKMVRGVWKEGVLHNAAGRLVGQYLIEGLNTICNSTLMQDHLRTARKLAQDVVGTFNSTAIEVDALSKETTRSLTFANAAQAHYGQVQRFMLEELVPRFGRLGVSRVVWTAHEAKGRDDMADSNSQVFNALGPATIGRAAVDKTTLKFGHTFHLTVESEITKDAKGSPLVKREFRAWFVSHPDDTLTRMKWPAKVSLPIARSQELLRRFPGGFIPLSGGKSLVEFMEFLQQDTLGSKGSEVAK